MRERIASWIHATREHFFLLRVISAHQREKAEEGGEPKQVDEYWVRRLNAVGRAQGRYMATLALALIFFPSVSWIVSREGGGSTLRVPLLELDVGAPAVLMSGPLVIGALVLMILGTGAALYEAARNLAPGHGVPRSVERYDEHPYGLEMLLYTTRKAPQILRGVASLIFPTALMFALVGGAWLSWAMPIPQPTALLVGERLVLGVAAIRVGLLLIDRVVGWAIGNL